MKKLALAGILAVCLAFPAMALAKSIKLTGGVVKDPDSKISLKVVKKNGKVTALDDFKLRGLDFRCGGKTYEDFGKIEILDRIPVNDRGTFKARLPNVDNPKEKLRISGRVKKNGKVVSGNVKTNQLTISGKDCDVPKQHYELSK